MKQATRNSLRNLMISLLYSRDKKDIFVNGPLPHKKYLQARVHPWRYKYRNFSLTPASITFNSSTL
jgi:hypothetical protein